MTDTTRATLDGLMEHVAIGPAPVDSLLREGQAARRRKNRTLIAGAGALTALVVVGGLTVQAATDTSGTRVADRPSIAPPADTHMVGVGQVAVAVPTAWAANAASCNTPIRDTYFFPYPQDCLSASAPTVSSVAITDGPFTETGTRLGDLADDGNLDGHRVVASGASCSPGQGEYCRQTFGVPDLDAYFTVTIPVAEDWLATIAAIRDSLTILPDDETTVPFTPYALAREGGQAATVRALQQAGLNVEVKRVRCPPTANCVEGVTGVEPEPGSVAPIGSTAIVTVMQG